MAYLGNAPAEKYISFERQVFTIVNSQTAYTLSHSVTNENDIRLVVNNIVQEPGSGKAYTASGTTLTLSAALVNGTDEMYCVFLGRAVGTVNPPAGSVDTSQLAADAVTNAKIADDAISDEQLDPTVITGQTAETSIATDDLILLSDTSASGALRKMTRANFVSGVGGTNTPYFYVYLNSAQTVSDNTSTKIAFDTEVYDTGNDFDLTNDYFVVPEDGTYFFIGGVGFYDSGANNAINGCSSTIQLGSTVIAQSENNFYSNAKPSFFSSELSVIRECSANDQITLYGRCDSTASNPRIGGGSSQHTFLGGYKIIT